MRRFHGQQRLGVIGFGVGVGIGVDDCVMVVAPNDQVPEALAAGFALVRIGTWTAGLIGANVADFANPLFAFEIEKRFATLGKRAFAARQAVEFVVDRLCDCCHEPYPHFES